MTEWLNESVRVCACACLPWMPSSPSTSLGRLPLPPSPLGASLSLLLPWVPPSGLCYLACLPLACATLHVSLCLALACLPPYALRWLACLLAQPECLLLLEMSVFCLMFECLLLLVAKSAVRSCPKTELNIKMLKSPVMSCPKTELNIKNAKVSR